MSNKLSKEDNKIFKNALKNHSSVTICYTDEAGIWQWSISLDEKPEFWLDSFVTRQEAIDWCNKKKLPITHIPEDKI